MIQNCVPEWVEVGRIENIPQRGARVVSTPIGDIAVFRTGEDEIFALRDRCPHRGGPLSQGIVHGRRVTCALHGWKIELADGVAVPPDQGCTKRFDVRVEDGVISLRLRASVAKKVCRNIEEETHVSGHA